ncbi:MAG: rRNA adenine N-6-methyltransferase family protein, partial [Bacteroidota bacterium]
MKAKKSFGQHFLNREDIAQRIADSLQLSEDYQHIVEVGPGQGMLTKYLLEKEQKVLVVEA